MGMMLGVQLPCKRRNELINLHDKREIATRNINLPCNVITS